MKKLMMVIFLDTHLSPTPSESSTLEDNKLEKPITSHLMKALRLSNSQNLQLTTSTLLNLKDIHLMNIFILMNLLKGAGMLTRATAKQLSTASAHECLFVDFLFEKEPKKVSEALKNHIKQSERGISINQEKYVKDLLKKYDINGSSVKTPMAPPNNLGPDLKGKSVNETQYRGMIGSLMYLTTSRPDIPFSTCLCARYRANPKKSHLIAIKRIFRYLK
ncbi:hypothetical protein Tco_1025867, partial [Tanacetum coccineum]